MPTAVEEARARDALPPPAIRRQIREAAQLSRRRVGREVGASGQAVTLWEKDPRDGGFEPRGERLVRYTALLAELVGYIAERDQPQPGG